jgi:hypothetical protein
MHFISNHHLLKADIRAIAGEITALKRVLRAPWQAPMASQQRELCRLKLRATELYALSAFARGKLHIRCAPLGASSDWNALDYHRCIAERLAASYQTVLEQSA